jgi:hypothetical protein
MNHMNRLFGIAGAMLLALLVVVPGAAAAEPWNWGQTEPLIIASGADIILPADQHVDVLVVFNGHGRIEGDARTIVVINGTADLVGSHAGGIVAIQSHVTIDAASIVSGDIRTSGATVDGATAATVTGRIRDLGPDMALGWLAIGSVLFFVYLAFALSAVAAGVVVAGLAARQVRGAVALIATEPLQVVGAAFIGLIALITIGIVAVVTIVGIPFGLGVLALVMPALFLAGYIVAGIGIGEAIVGRMTASGPRERPYLAAFVGLGILGAVSIVPPIGGLVSFVGFGAVVLLMWRVARRGSRPANAASATVAATAAG